VTKARIAVLALLGVGFGWGAAFVLMKDAIAQQDLYDFLATRFTIAALAMALLQPQRVMAIRARDLKVGLPLGVVLAGGYITQTIGLDLTTAAISGFITGLYVVLTPILAWLMVRRRPSKKLALAVGFAVIGLLLISGATATSVELQLGQLWLLACALLFALHIFLLGEHGGKSNPYTLAMIQIAGVAAVSWVFALADGYQAPPNGQVWTAILFTALFATILAFWLQTWAQTVLDSARVALILTSEVVFAAGIAVAVGQEQLALQTVFGGALMVVAMLVVEWPENSRAGALKLKAKLTKQRR
jgi:drug/metabolite transporter (DMT)-like permease